MAMFNGVAILEYPSGLCPSRYQEINSHVGHDHFPVPTSLIAGIHELPDLPNHLPRRSDIAQVAIRLDVVKRGFDWRALARLERRTAQNK